MFTLRDKLSALLMDSAENKHYRVHIPLELNENQGLSTNDMLTVEEIWQHQTEGIIMLKIIGINEPKELEDFEGCIPQIYNYMNDYMAEKTNYIPTFEEKLASILNTYRLESEVVMAEFLESEKVPKNTTIAEAFRLYVEAMKRVNGDEFYVIKEGLKEEL